MKVYPQKLAAHLSKKLASVYFISGDEPLQREECGDLVRRAAKRAGYTSRELYIADGDFNWQQLTAASDALSLFAEQRLIEVKIPSGKVNKKAAEALKAYAERPASDAILLLISEKLEGRASTSAWYRALDALGVTVQVWPLKPQELPNWIDQRLREQGFLPDKDALMLLSQKVEGNLLAAKQEIDKLCLLLPAGPLSAEVLLPVITDSARYSVFDLGDALLLGKLKRSCRILSGLRAEGTEAVLVLWALLRELRTLTAVSLAVQSGQSVPASLKAERVFGHRLSLYQRALPRYSADQWLSLLQAANELELVLKGRVAGDFWLEATALACRFCAQPLHRDSP